MIRNEKRQRAALIVVFVDQIWPCDHSFIEEMYSKRITCKKVKCVIVFKATRKSRPSVRRWNNSIGIVPPTLGRILDSLWRLCFLHRLSKKREVSWVISRNTYTPVLYWSFLKKGRSALQISHMKEEGKIKLLKESNPLVATFLGLGSRPMRVVRQAAIETADLFFPVSEAMRQLLPKAEMQKSVVIPLGIDPFFGEESIIKRAETAKNTHLKTNTVKLGYIGTLNTLRRPKLMIDLVRHLRDKDIDAQLLAYGAGPTGKERDSLRNYARTIGIHEYVSLNPPVPRASLPEKLLNVDIGLALFPADPFFQQNSPTKVTEYLALGLPVVGCNNPDQELLVRYCGGGIVSQSFDIEHIADDIVKVLGMKIVPLCVRERVLELRSYDVIAKKIRDLLLVE